MVTILSALASALSFRLRTRASLELELIALRHQVSVLRRRHKGRLRLLSTDRLLWVWLYRIWPRCLDAMVLVKPATVIQWHRKGFRLYWRRRSRPLGRPRKSTQIRDLIRRMSMANPLWGAPRIHGELLKLGIAVCQATVGRYMPWRPKAPSPNWRSFLHNHMGEIAAIDMFVVATATFRVLYRTPGQTMSDRPVPSQLDQVSPRFSVQKAGPYHPFGRIRITPLGKGDLRILRESGYSYRYFR